MHHTISYGKAHVPFYRVYAQPLAGVAPIPESPFTGRPNTLFAAEIDVEVFGDNFLPAYTHGDNSLVVATDSMKNFVLNQALAYDGATLEGFLAHLGRLLLATYPQMQSLRVTGRETPFGTVPVPTETEGTPGQSASFNESPVLYQRLHDDRTFAALDFARDGEGNGEAGVTITDHRCGRVGLELLKVTGSAFTRFVRDTYTTLPERGDRPLFIMMDVYWRYASLDDLLAPDHTRYVPAEQVRDLARTVFHEFVSESIQHLVHEMGQRLLTRFPQLAAITFEAQNHTPDPMAISDTDSKVKVYSTPFPAFGLIKLSLERDT